MLTTLTGSAVNTLHALFASVVILWSSALVFCDRTLDLLEPTVSLVVTRTVFGLSLTTSTHLVFLSCCRRSFSFDAFLTVQDCDCSGGKSVVLFVIVKAEVISSGVSIGTLIVESDCEEFKLRLDVLVAEERSTVLDTRFCLFGDGVAKSRLILVCTDRNPARDTIGVFGEWSAPIIPLWISL